MLIAPDAFKEPSPNKIEFRPCSQLRTTNRFNLLMNVWCFFLSTFLANNDHEVQFVSLIFSFSRFLSAVFTALIGPQTRQTLTYNI